MLMLIMLMCGDFLHCIFCSFLYVTIFYSAIFHSQSITIPILKTIGYNDAGKIGKISTQVQSAVIPLTKWPFGALTQTIQLGIATTIILEHSFTLLQQGEHDLGKALAL
ncbi:hypothetical protein M405DRAFT_939141, partial [Rhizopogon salebrosus TDB-379]